MTGFGASTYSVCAATIFIHKSIITSISKGNLSDRAYHNRVLHSCNTNPSGLVIFPSISIQKYQFQHIMHSNI